MVNKKGFSKNRIPVHFVDEDTSHVAEAGSDSERDDESRPETSSATSGEPGLATDVVDGVTEATTASASSEGGERLPDPSTADGSQPAIDGQDYEAAASSMPASDGNSLRPPGDSAATGPVLAELIATRAELKRVEAERSDLREALARRQADFENYRKRVERERADSYTRMVGDLVSKLLPVLDNLRRALETEGSLQASESEEFRHFLHGVELIYRQLRGVLEGLGLQAVPALGHPFDPHVHEAVLTEHTEEYEPDTVIQEIVPGYRLGEKLLRPAIVKVATR
jgi:molecular chaperone GrpE